jgi:uncharacterized protein (DUF2336 family)
VSLRAKIGDVLIVKALRGETVTDRALATQAIGRTVRQVMMTDADRDFAEKLFDHLSRDTCEEVRRALSVTLKSSPNLPRPIAQRLINDVDSIAMPILASSPVVTDDDLIAVLRSRASLRIRAIATRGNISERLSGAVISFGDGPAVAALAANDGALISEADAGRLVRLAKNDDLIREAALTRQDMPQALAADLIDRHVDGVGDRLAERTPHAPLLTADTRSRAHAGWTAQDWNAGALRAYVAALHEKGRLSEDVIARAAGQGDWRFVQLALATLSGISSAKAGLMAFDAKPFGLRALAKRAGLSEAARDLLVVSASAFRDLEKSHSPITRRGFQRRMAERIASHPEARQYEALWLDWLDDALTPKVA